MSVDAADDDTVELPTRTSPISKPAEPANGAAALSESPANGDEPSGEANKFTFLHACGFNTMMMFGTGPFISVPFCLAATDPPGPQAMIGYGVAAFGCLADSLIWGELGSRYPRSGGSYHYLRECFGRDTWGQLAAFIYTWQFWVSGPAEVASGFIAISEYLVYIHGDARDHTKALTALGLLAVTVLALVRRNADLGNLVYALWAVTIGAIIFVLVAGFANFNPDNYHLPPTPTYPQPAFGGGGSAFIVSLGAAMRFGVYDFTGYYDVCQMGGEVRNPRRTIPYSCIATCAIVLVVYLLTYVAIVGYLPWDGPTGFVSRVLAEDDASAYIMATFAEALAGRAFGIFFTMIVVLTIFGSVFSMLAGMIFLPGAAADDGVFFRVFAYRSPHAYTKDRPLVSLGVLGLLSSAWCFFSLDTVIDAMTTMLVLVQFIGQAVGLCVLRYRIHKGYLPDEPLAWKVPLLPLIVSVQLTVFCFIFGTSPNWFASGDDPLIDLAVLFVVAGALIWLGRQYAFKAWPFERKSRVSLRRTPSQTPLEPDDVTADVQADAT